MIEDDHFTIGAKLPWVHEAVLSIIEVAPGGSPKEKQETKIRKRAVNVYGKALHEAWCKGFGKEHILERKAVCKKLRNGLQSYFSEVQCSHEQQSVRELKRKWCASKNIHCLLDLLKPTSDPEQFA